MAVHRDRLQISAIVDIVPEVLREAGDFLDLPESERYGAMDDAFADAEADFCVVAVPPWHHREAILKAVERGLPVLSEKPISDKLSEVTEIVQAVKKAGVKMTMIQNYRFTPRMLAFRDVLQSGRLGRLQYLVARFQADYRVFGSWGAKLGLSDFRHEMDDPLVIDASIHHFLCAHRSGPNQTAQRRRGVVLNYRSVNATVNEARAAAHRKYVDGLKTQD